MRFRIDTTGDFYSDEDKEKLEKLGFKFEPADPFCVSLGLPWHKVGGQEVFIEIGSLQELIDFQEKWGKIIIRSGYRGEKVIEIYDDWRE